MDIFRHSANALHAIKRIGRKRGRERGLEEREVEDESWRQDEGTGKRVGGKRTKERENGKRDRGEEVLHSEQDSLRTP